MSGALSTVGHRRDDGMSIAGVIRRPENKLIIVKKVLLLKVELSHCGMSQERFLKWYEATRTDSEEQGKDTME